MVERKGTTPERDQVEAEINGCEGLHVGERFSASEHLAASAWVGVGLILALILTVATIFCPVAVSWVLSH